MPQTAQEQLSQLFGSYKAEWLSEQLFDFFTEPDYFPELVTPRPCMLVGGRGTGKTTVLRCLSYEGQFALNGRQAEGIRKSSYYGLYYRVNTNRVTAFNGPELAESEWVKVFAHYFNILLCELLLKLVNWYQLHAEPVALSEQVCRKIALSLHLGECKDLRELTTALDLSRVCFESYINNIADGHRPALSIQGGPIDILAEALHELPQFAKSQFFFLIDEYENFEDYQQQVVNSLIKHSGQLYTFKVGVRELGLRRRATLNENEQLISPADYVRININEKLEGERFHTFALRVCNGRVSRLQTDKGSISTNLSDLLENLNEDEEAQRLGLEQSIPQSGVLKEGIASQEAMAYFAKLTPLERYFVHMWAKAEGIAIVEVLEDAIANPAEWRTRFGNYKHALLYTIRQGKRGIRKYYCGWNSFVQLAGCNIRYLLELVEQSLLLHLQRDGRLGSLVPADVQTLAAQQVGRKNLSELEGLSVHGAHLTKLLLGLGRVFQVMAEQLEGHAPEVNQFRLGDESSREQEDDGVAEHVDKILHAAVMHLALVRWSGSKLADDGETRDYDYMIHPIYAPFFIFSYRRKRRMLLSRSQLLGLIGKPKEMIREILIKSKREPEANLPEQLLLFEAYYHVGS